MTQEMFPARHPGEPVRPSSVEEAVTRRKDVGPPASSEPMHERFGLTYANYLVLPRAVLQSMPVEWQSRFVAALDELHDAYGHLDWPNYDVRALARAAEFGVYTACPECEGEGVAEDGSRCPTCEGECEVYEDRYETAEEVGFRTDPIPHYNRGRTRIEPKASA